MKFTTTNAKLKITTTKNTTTNTMHKLVNCIEMNYKNKGTNYTSSLEELAKIISYAVVNKCIRATSGNSEQDNKIEYKDISFGKYNTLLQLKRDIGIDTRNLNIFYNEIEKNVKIEKNFNKKGDLKVKETYCYKVPSSGNIEEYKEVLEELQEELEEVKTQLAYAKKKSKKEELQEELEELEEQRILIQEELEEVASVDGLEEDNNGINDRIFKLLNVGNGMPLINSAIVAILEELKRIEQRYGKVTINSFYRQYDKKVVNKAIRISTKDNANYYKFKTTTPIQECFKAVRKEIENNNATAINNSKYSYIDGLFKDDNNNTIDDVLLRVSPKSVLNTSTTSMDCTKVITANNELYKDIEELEELLFEKLSTREKTMLNKYLSGYGSKAIATYFNVSLSTVKTTLRRAQRKAINKGIELNLWTISKEEELKRRAEQISREQKATREQNKKYKERKEQREEERKEKILKEYSVALTLEEYQQAIKNSLYNKFNKYSSYNTNIVHKI